LSFWLDRQARKARPLRRAFFRLADSDVTDGKYFKADSGAGGVSACAAGAGIGRAFFDAGRVREIVTSRKSEKFVFPPELAVTASIGSRNLPRIGGSTMDNGTNKLSTSPSSGGAQPQQRRLHPLVATAAGAVIVASLVATAAMTGLFPKASSNSAQNPQTQTAPVAQQPVVDSAAPSPAQQATAAQQQAAQQQAAQQQAAQQQASQQQAAQQAAAQQATQQQAQQAPAQPQPAQPSYAQQPPQHHAYCSTCGTVEAISAVKQEGHGTGIGAVGGAVAGGVVGNQFGGGGGRTAMTLLGALGGGLAGNSVEKHLRSETDYSVRVRMENGHTRTFTYKNPPPFQQGERVHIQNGTLVAG
jgi:outer membrane lipoprotein SlyB